MAASLNGIESGRREQRQPAELAGNPGKTASGKDAPWERYWMMQKDLGTRGAPPPHGGWDNPRPRQVTRLGIGLMLERGL